MKDNTVKLSGHTKDRFLERFFADEPGLDADARRRLTGRAQSAFTSLRVRKALMAQQRPTKVGPGVRPAAIAPEVEPMTAAPVVPPPVVAPVAPAPAPETAFDTYAVKLVPVFQREGRTGLLAALAGVSSIEHLRQMAKAQQIVLPQPLRTGEAEADAVRTGIADAVAKRVADRRAAAG